MYLHYFSDIVCNYFTMAEKSNKEILVDTWKDHGTVDYNDSFKKISDTEVEHLKRTIKKMGGALTEKHDGVNLCIADDHYKMAKKEPTPTAKNCFCLLAKRYIHLHYQSRIMMVRNCDQFF